MTEIGLGGGSVARPEEAPGRSDGLDPDEPQVVAALPFVRNAAIEERAAAKAALPSGEMCAVAWNWCGGGIRYEVSHG